MPKIDPLEAIRKAHQEVKQEEQDRASCNGWTFVIIAILIIEFILVKLLGA